MRDKFSMEVGGYFLAGGIWLNLIGRRFAQITADNYFWIISHLVGGLVLL
jgi:hypothetical protein